MNSGRQWRMVIASLLVLGGIPTVSSAGAVVCAVKATPAKLSRFLPASDPSRFVSGATETCNTIIGDTATALQIDLYNTVPLRHIKVVTNATVGGTVQPQSMQEMDASEQAAVDNAITAEKGRRDAWYAETQTPGVCKYNTPGQIDTKVDAVKQNNQNNINNMSLAQADKNELIAVANRLTEAIRQAVTCDAARASGGS